MIKLNLGSGHDNKKTWINCDIDASTNPDVVLDLRNPLPFKSLSFDQLLLQDTLEHVTKQQALLLLAQCHRVLNHQGAISIRVPNVYQIIDQFSHDQEVMMEFLYGNTCHNSAWGAHKYGYTKKSLVKTIKKSGFTDIKINSVTTNYALTATKTAQKAPLKILIIQQSPDWGGAEEWMANLVNEFCKSNNQVHAVTNHQKLIEAWSRTGAQTTRLPFVLDVIGDYKGLIKTTILFPFALIWYSKLIFNSKKTGVNILLASGFSEKLLITWIAKLAGISVVWFEYGPLHLVFKKNFYLPKILYHLTKHFPNRIITISQHSKQSLINTASISLAKLVVINPGVTVSKSLTPNTQTVGSLSRLAPEKGQRLLIRAWKHVVKKHPNAKLLISGSGPDKKHLQQLITRFSLNQTVKLLGFTTNKDKFFDQLDIFVFSSIWEMEGFGIAATEALAHGKPVVGFDHGPVSEIVTDKVGILVKPITAKALSQAICELLENKKYRRHLSSAARQQAIINFNLPSQAKKVTDILKNVVMEELGT